MSLIVKIALGIVAGVLCLKLIPVILVLLLSIPIILAIIVFLLIFIPVMLIAAISR